MRAAVILALIGLALAGLVLEAGLRVYAELRAPRYVGAAVPTDDTDADPLLVAWFKPNYVAPGGWPAYDASGFRLNGAPRPAALSGPIAMLGGSTAYGWDAEDDQTIPAVLEQRLRGAGPRPLRVPVPGVAPFFDQERLAAANPGGMRLPAWSIGELARRVRADGGCLVVAWQPVAGLPDGALTPDEQQAERRIAARAPTWPTTAPRTFTQLRDDTRAVFASGQAVEADATYAFDREQQPVYAEDGVHYTPLGNRL